MPKNKGNDNIIIDINPSSIEIAENNDAFMLLSMGVCTDDYNYNGAKFPLEFLEQSGQSLIGMPLVVDRENLENGNYNNLTHKFDGKELATDSVGAFQDVWIEETEDGFNMLMATAKVWKRYPETCKAIVDLHTNGELKFSTEVLVSEYEMSEQGRIVQAGSFIGHAIVTSPAEHRAVSMTLVAEAYAKDIEEKGGTTLLDINEKSIGNLIAEIESQIMQAEDYNAYVLEVYTDRVLARNWADGKYYVYEYMMEGEEPKVDMESKYEASIIVQKKEETAEDDMVLASTRLGLVKDELETVKEELSTLIAEKEELEQAEVIEEDEAEVETSEEEVVVEEENDDKLSEMAETIIKLQEEIESLRPFKEELMEKKAEEKRIADEAKREELKTLAEKHLGKELSEEVETFIAELDEKSIRLAIADMVIAEKKAVKVEEDIVVETSDKKNLQEDKKTIKLY